MSRSMANRTSMRLTASVAIGALLRRARSKELAPPVCPARGFDNRACFAVGLVELGKAGVGVGLH